MILYRAGMTWLVALLGLTACTEMPVYNLANTFSIEVREVTKNDKPIKLDFLWVVDNSASMCQEQASLAESFENFVTQLGDYLNVDINLAVTTTDALNGRGEFSKRPSKQFPNACAEKELLPCATNNECVDAFGADWKCNPPPSTGGSLLLYNKNRSLNSSCTYNCNSMTDDECCEKFCCGEEQSCDDQCGADGGCTQTCVAPGGSESADPEDFNCVAQPDTESCPNIVTPHVLTGMSLDMFPCIATVGADQSYTANLEGGLKTAWMALDPAGLNSEQSSDFLRDDAYLIIVFVSDEDDCSIDEDFASPSFDCENNNDCPGYTRCEDGLCAGVVKKDYYNNCALLGEYKGAEHHECAYNPRCDDCDRESDSENPDADCDDGWYCKEGNNKEGAYKKGNKCRPWIYGFNTIANFQQPAGTPLFALAPVSKYYSQLRSLKTDPAKVLVAAIVGDAVVQKSDQQSLISSDCLDDEKLLICQDYWAAKADTSAMCKEDPHAEGCENYLALKLACARECYVASKGDNTNPQAKNSYVCTSPFGTADWGNRYIRLAEMFGPNGVVSNICAETGISPALETVAELIIKRVTKICLPRHVKEGERITITRSYEDDDGLLIKEKLVEGTDEDYQIEFPTQDCCVPDNDTGECTGTLKAVSFNEVLDPSWEIELKYEADLGID